MRKLLPCLLTGLLSCSSLFAQNTWTISIANQGTAGGYVVDEKGNSTELHAYSDYHPPRGFRPAWYIRFPKGNYSILSENHGTIEVRNMDKNEDLAVTGNAKSFSFRAPQNAWYRFMLTGGNPGQNLHDFIISSKDVSGKDRVYLASWRSVPSLHLNTFNSSNNRLPKGDAFDWIYDEVLIPEEADYRGTYVEAFGFAGGYIGIQNNGLMADNKTKNHTIIFSSWDNGDTDSNPALANYKRSGVLAIDSTLQHTVAERFGGEGTGVHVLLNGDYWRPGHWVRFLLNVRPEQIRLKDGSNYENLIISAWYNVRGLDDKWHYISSQRMAGRTNYFGRGFNAFLEEFTRGSTSQGHMPHKAYYRRAFTRSMQGGEWYNRNLFTFGHTDGGTTKGARNDRYQVAISNFQGEPAVYMQSGGYIEPKGGHSIRLPYVQPGDFLPTDTELAQLIERDVNPALQSQDHQRMQTAIADVLDPIAQKGWKVHSASSQELQGESKGNGPAHLVLDGDAETYWHTQWSGEGAKSNYPYSITFVHDSDVTLDQIGLTVHRGHGSQAYKARIVQVDAQVDGKFVSLGTYTLSETMDQTIRLKETLVLKKDAQLRLTFTAGYGDGAHFMALAEVNFSKKNPESLRKLLREHYEKAGQFNRYTKTDVEKHLGLIYAQLDKATPTQIAEALTRLAHGAKLVKYGPVKQMSDLNAERAYVLTNASGYGALVQAEGSTLPTLRSATNDAALDAYKAPAAFDQPTANWLLVADENSPYYLVYNLGTGRFLAPTLQGKGTASSTSEHPVWVKIHQENGKFVFTPLTDQRYKRPAGLPMCAVPTADNGAELSQASSARDNGKYWTLRDNFSLTPDKALVAALRQAAKTGKFQKPSNVARLTTTTEHAIYDLAGHRLLEPTTGSPCIVDGHKVIR